MTYLFAVVEQTQLVVLGAGQHEKSLDSYWLRFAKELLSNRVLVEKFKDYLLIFFNAREIEGFSELDGPSLIVLHTGRILLATVLKGHKWLGLTKVVKIFDLLKCNG